MKASEIMLDETLPHGTHAGYLAGCRGSHCPGVERLGMSCRTANSRFASDLSYRRRIQGGLSPEAIWAEDQLEFKAPSVVADGSVVDVHGNGYAAPSVTVAASETPVTFADFLAEPVKPPKWAVRRLWVAVGPDGSLHGPFEDQPAGFAFVADALRPASATPAERRPYRRFTEEESARLRVLHAEGLSDSAMARELGRKQNVIKQKREAIGLAPNAALARESRSKA